MDICVFGDSVTKGVVFDQEKNKYIFSKESFFHLLEESIGLNVKNYSKFGCNIAKGMEIMEKQADSLSQYDYTIIEYGGNDCDLEWPEIAKTPDDEHPAQVPLEDFKRIYRDMIDKVKACGSKPVLFTLPPLDAQRFFDWVTKDINKENVMKYLGNDVEFIYHWHEGYSKAVLEIAAEKDVPVMDIRSIFLKQDNYKDLLCIDGMHPNTEGHKLIADYLEGIASQLMLHEISY